jgi:hypothetical protein
MFLLSARCRMMPLAHVTFVQNVNTQKHFKEFAISDLFVVIDDGHWLELVSLPDCSIGAYAKNVAPTFHLEQCAS